MIDPMAVFYCTEPANKEAAEEGFAKLYARHGHRKRPAVTWMPSPRAAFRFMHRNGQWLQPSRCRMRPATMRRWMLERVFAIFGDDEARVVERDEGVITLFDEWTIAQRTFNQARGTLFHAASHPFASTAQMGIFYFDGVSQTDVMYGHQDVDLLLGAATAPVVALEQAQALADVRLVLQLALDTGWFFPFDTMVVAADRPSDAHHDGEGRLHCETGPAMSWRDGKNIWAWHGTSVPKATIATPASELTVDQVEREINAEVRRVLLERIGYERYLKETEAMLVHEDATGKLWHKQAAVLAGPLTDRGTAAMSWQAAVSENIWVVEVVNATAEPNGTFKRYFLRVPPGMSTAKQAVAWTFSMSADQYKPSLQT